VVRSKTYRCVISDEDGAVFAPVLLFGDPVPACQRAQGGVRTYSVIMGWIWMKERVKVVRLTGALWSPAEGLTLDVDPKSKVMHPFLLHLTLSV
jgi:hypothetical protein